MKIWEFCKEENNGKKYKDKEGDTWEVVNQISYEGAELICNGACIYEIYTMSKILEMEFEEIIDWSKVPVDTKVLVSHYGEEWCKRHFARYKDGKIYCFNGGGTSWTRKECISSLTEWNYAKLWQEGEE